MSLLDELGGIDPDDLSDADAIRIAEAIQLEQDAAWWAEAVADFPAPETWPYEYEPVLAWRRAMEELAGEQPGRWPGIREYYRTRRVEFILHWCNTYDPRNAGRRRADGSPMPVKMPLILFKRQREWVEFLDAAIAGEVAGMAEKSRDMGVTWVAGAYSVALWACVSGSAVGWGSRKEQLVDRIGDPDSIFEKLRMLVDGLPPFLLPRGFNRLDHMTYMKIVNPETGATITGEAGDNIGRGGRKLVYFKDESAHYERPEKIEAALADNTNVQIDISTPNGLGNVFHRAREIAIEWTPGLQLERGKTYVFIFDWSDHPAKTKEWYETRKRSFQERGLAHVFAQEVDRDYAASVEGIIIPAEWVRSAIGAHIKLDWPVGKRWSMALDVADGGGDTNALAGVLGSVIAESSNWSERDTGVTTRRAVEACQGKGFVNLQYDSIGVGSGVKAEANRLQDEGLMPPSISFIPWHAGARPLNPDDPVIPDDRDSPTNADMFMNLKAQAWWRARIRFENTHRAVTEGIHYPVEEMVSIDPELPNLRQIQKQLSQPVRKGGALKIVVDKTPEGTRSPNDGDAIVMALHPVPGLRPIFSTSLEDIAIDNFTIPPHWPRGFAMRSDGERVCALWAAYDRSVDVMFVFTEHSRHHAEPSANAAAILARGKWIPGVLEPPPTAKVEELRAHLAVWIGLGIARLDLGDRSIEAGITDMHHRSSTMRLRVFKTCTDFFTEYRGFRRGEDGGIIGEGLMNCARLLCRPSTISRFVVKPVDPMLRVTPWGGDY